ncbi:hypothetical protein NPIL_397461 [Nephila pilipes]|uniref:Uncharacterized protein n=1 Tax=Nephila pilipes TaxID=299642 RepID=A0A8X6TGY4_NEPPI|nr:hypothetical protein NPIL_397461 [Nephila pilipes]
MSFSTVRAKHDHSEALFPLLPEVSDYRCDNATDFTMRLVYFPKTGAIPTLLPLPYRNAVLQPSKEWSIRPFIGIPCLSITSPSKFAKPRAERPFYNEAKSILCRWTISILRMSIDAKDLKAINQSIIDVNSNKCFNPLLI